MKSTIIALFAFVLASVVVVDVLSAPAAADPPQAAVMECVCVGESTCQIPQDSVQADGIQKESASRCAKNEVCCPKQHVNHEDSVQLIPEIFKF